MASAAMAASVVGVPAATAPQAQAQPQTQAIGTDSGAPADDGGAARESGAPAALGDRAARTALLRESSRTPRVGLPSRADVNSVVGLVPAGALRDRAPLSALAFPSAPPREDTATLSGAAAHAH